MLKFPYMIIARLIFALMLLMPALAFANSAEAQLNMARDYFKAGEYQKARSLGVEIGTSDSYLLASEALAAEIILGHYEKPNKPAKQARELVNKAIALDPDNLDARFHHAVAFGLETQSTGVLKAWRKKMPSRMRQEIESLQALAPKDPRGHALMGAWHLGIVNKVGERNAYSWYKASPDVGTKYFEMAMQASGNDILITSNYASSVILMGNAEYGQKLLASVAQKIPENAAEKDIQTRMNELSLLADNLKKQKRAAKRFLGNKAP